MKAVLAPLILAGLTAATAADATSMGGGGAVSYVTAPVTPVGPAYEKKWALRDFIKEGRALQAADGGTLTPAHRAYLQAKLDAIRAGNY